MDASQLTGTASTYARKYALNGLLALEDCEDPDSFKSDYSYNSNPNSYKKEQQNQKRQPTKEEKERAEMIDYINNTIMAKKINVDEVKQHLQKNYKVNNPRLLNINLLGQFADTIKMWGR